MFAMNRRKVLAALLAAHCTYLSHSVHAGENPGVMPSDLVDGETLLESTDDLGSPSLDFQEDEQPTLVSPDAASYQFYITDLESRLGPYANGLAEQLLGLGSVYQDQGLHAEAIDIFKRAVHVARINGGLNAPEQIPLLQRLIRSLVAVGDFESADERQFYLYRVQANAYGAQSPQMSAAMLERAEWERQAYYLSVGETSFLRLLTMWELYSNVLRNVARQEGKLSESLLRPLQGLLQTQYLISSYAPGSPTGFQAGAVDDGYAEEARFSMVRVSNYKQGQAVITAIREVYDYNEGDQSPRPAETLIELGDWHLWHQKRDSALEAYQQAWDELAALENGARLLDQYFGQPALLPDIPGAHRDLLRPQGATAFAEVAFGVNDRGRVEDLELLSTAPADPTADEGLDENPVQLLRRLKRLQFRPRFENREPVAVDNIRRRYAY